MAAIFAYKTGKTVEQCELAAYTSRLEKRGPDGNGIWLSGKHDVGLAHSRLSIIDLHERASQPMHLAREGIVISFNGEIYNYKSLRQTLQLAGWEFRTTSDTEVLLYLYLAYNKDMLEHVHGMFAFALWDSNANQLFCARDPYGIKPLYYFDDGNTLRIASQVKTIRKNSNFINEPDPGGVVGFYLFGHIPEPHTLYRDIKALPAGHYMCVKKGGSPRIQRYISVSSIFHLSKSATLADGESLRLMRGALNKSVVAHSMADVPVGLFLSSGFDSGVLLGLMSQTYQSAITAVTLGFEEYAGEQDDESPLAAEIADICGARHVISRISLAETRANLPKFFDAMDQPSIDGLNTWLVSKAASQQGLKVALSGVGGDELFGGYPSFTDIPKWRYAMQKIAKIPYLTNVLRQSFQALYGMGLPINPKLRGLTEFAGNFSGAYFVRRGLFMPWELDHVLDREVCKEGLESLAPFALIDSVMEPDPGTDQARIATLESCLYMKNQLLRDTDWAGMDHSLEVRTPLIDINLLRRLAPLVRATSGNKMKTLFSRVPAQKFPDTWYTRKKTGFTVPISDWLTSTVELDAWKRVPILRRSRCHWARRWAHTVITNALESG